MCCSVLQCVAVCCSVWKCVAVCGSVLQCVQAAMHRTLVHALSAPPLNELAQSADEVSAGGRGEVLIDRDTAASTHCNTS